MTEARSIDMDEKILEDYRPGACGSMMDEYERALEELKSVLKTISETDYTRVADPETDNHDCRSIATIMNHVVHSGYFYSNYYRDALSLDSNPVPEQQVDHPNVIGALDKMFAYTLEMFDGKWEVMNEKIDDVFIDARWGLTYNIDQMIEHSIVHVLRHRRQIEKFLLILKRA